MKSKEFRDLSLDELKTKEKELYEELFKLRFKHSTNQLKETDKITKAKRDLARAKTIIKEKSVLSMK